MKLFKNIVRLKYNTSPILDSQIRWCYANIGSAWHLGSNKELDTSIIFRFKYEDDAIMFTLRFV